MYSLIRFPPRCSRCLAETSGKHELHYTDVRPGGHYAQLKVAVPLCPRCADRLDGLVSTCTTLGFATWSVALVLALVGVLGDVPTLFFTFIALVPVGLWFVIAQPRLSQPARIVVRDQGMDTIRFKNKEYQALFDVALAETEKEMEKAMEVTPPPPLDPEPAATMPPEAPRPRRPRKAEAGRLHAIIWHGRLEHPDTMQYILTDVSKAELEEKMLGSDLAFLLDIVSAEQVEELFSTDETRTTDPAFGAEQKVRLEWCDCADPASHRREGAEAIDWE